MIFECPFCYQSSRNEGVINAHASAHKDDEGEPVMILQGAQFDLKRVVGGTGIFQCPSCEFEGLKGQIWEHYLDVHGSKVNPSSRQPEDLELPPAKKLKADTSVSSSPSPGSSSTDTAAGPITPPTSSPSRDLDKDENEEQINDEDKDEDGVQVDDEDEDDDGPTITYPIVVDTDRVFCDHPTTPSLFRFLNEQLSAVVRTCPYEQVMLGAAAADHDRLWKCSTILLSNKKYEYKRVFTLSLVADHGSCCFKCWTPQHPEFNHSGEPCAGGRSDWEGWWRAVPYLVWRTTYLREKVFGMLGVPYDAFYDAGAYSAWLTQPAHDLIDLNFNRKVTHLVAVVYVFFKLRLSGQLTPPGKGLVMDRTVLTA